MVREVPPKTKTATPAFDVKETQFIMGKHIQPENIKILSREIRYSHPRGSSDGENTASANERITTLDVAENPFLVNSQGYHHTSGTETSNQEQQEQYWGMVEPYPLELHEISSPPSRLSVSSLPPLPEESVFNSLSDTFSSRLSDLGLRLSNSGQFVPHNSLVNLAEVEKQTVDVGTQCTSIYDALKDLADSDTANSNAAIEDREQFVFVDHDIDGYSTTERSIVSLNDELSAPESDDERLQKRIKNWPRYIQNLLEA
ncbi:hypothetical protein Clacol_009326 [Clathrus columnatus]|uniref:Uncharacterized protein n=1 Tax=Clathrus columnatus TaxID=1419009 RepID=A0AAV5ARR6_9AGAM|nr:hypothetical protein Clacol_009326 [Clathrus columnatus]